MFPLLFLPDESRVDARLFLPASPPAEIRAPKGPRTTSFAPESFPIPLLVDRLKLPGALTESRGMPGLFLPGSAREELTHPTLRGVEDKEDEQDPGLEDAEEDPEDGQIRAGLFLAVEAAALWAVTKAAVLSSGDVKDEGGEVVLEVAEGHELCFPATTTEGEGNEEGCFTLSLATVPFPAEDALATPSPAGDDVTAFLFEGHPPPSVLVLDDVTPFLSPP